METFIDAGICGWKRTLLDWLLIYCSFKHASSTVKDVQCRIIGWEDCKEAIVAYFKVLSHNLRRVIVEN